MCIGLLSLCQLSTPDWQNAGDHMAITADDHQLAAAEEAGRAIRCEDCGDRYETKRSNTKVCGACRMLRDFIFIKSGRSRCVLCDNHFAPLYRGDWLCGNCEADRLRNRESVHCPVCKEYGPAWRDGVRACVRCLKAPAHRRTLTQALAARQQRTRAETGWTP